MGGKSSFFYYFCKLNYKNYFLRKRLYSLKSSADFNSKLQYSNPSIFFDLELSKLFLFETVSARCRVKGSLNPTFLKTSQIEPMNLSVRELEEEEFQFLPEAFANIL
jgi:hypothetical protein